MAEQTSVTVLPVRQDVQAGGITYQQASNKSNQPFSGSDEAFDPIACMRQIVEASDVSIEEIAEQGNLDARHLANALSGVKRSKLGLEEALTVCKVLKTDAYARAWAKSLGFKVTPLPSPQYASDDPVVHIRAAMNAFAHLIMMSNAFDRTDADMASALANLTAALSPFLNEATALAGKSCVSSNDLKRLDQSVLSFALKGSESAFPKELLAPFAQTLSNVYAAAAALKQFQSPAP